MPRSVSWQTALIEDRLKPVLLTSFNFDNAPTATEADASSAIIQDNPFRSAYAEAIGEPLVPDVTHLEWTGMQSSLRQWINESAPGRWRPGVVDLPVDVALGLPAEASAFGGTDVKNGLASAGAASFFSTRRALLERNSTRASNGNFEPHIRMIQLSMQSRRCLGLVSDWALQLLRPMPDGGYQQRLSNYRQASTGVL